MSDSELSDAPDVGIPPDFELENSLRREVNRATKNDEEFTLKTIRTASETRLGLPVNFYKDHAVWKGKSKNIVHDQINTEKEVPSSPELKSKSKPPAQKESESPRPAKRKSAEAQSPRPKKRKTKSDSDDQSSPLSDVESDTEPEVKSKKSTKTGKPTKATASKKKVKAAADESDEPSGAANASESEMSVVLDEEPKPKKKRKTKESEAKPKKPKASKPKASAEDDPDQAEIKRLQQWLVRCGIRKAWGIYLKPYETPKAKIKHLKEMLAEIGMTGRYSQEKAREIKEARELAADIEAVQEGEQRWGTGGKQSEDEDDGQSRGRLVRGARAQYDFLSSDGEETS